MALPVNASTLFSLPGFTIVSRSSRSVVASFGGVDLVAALFGDGVGVYAHPLQTILPPAVAAAVLGLEVPVSMSVPEFTFTETSEVVDVRKALLQLKPSTEGAAFPYSRNGLPTVPLLSGGRNLLVASLEGEVWKTHNGGGSLVYAPKVPQGAAGLAVHGSASSFMGSFSSENFLAHALVLGEPSAFSLSEVLSHAGAHNLSTNFRVHSPMYGFTLVCAFYSLVSGYLCGCAHRGVLVEVVWKSPSPGDRKEVARVAKLYASLCSDSLSYTGEPLVFSHDSKVGGSVLCRVSLPLNNRHVSLLSVFLSGLFRVDMPDLEFV